jgi:hypothetical protein
MFSAKLERLVWLVFARISSTSKASIHKEFIARPEYAGSSALVSRLFF